jgi:hypothetical protein
MRSSDSRNFYSLIYVLNINFINIHATDFKIIHFVSVCAYDKICFRVLLLQFIYKLYVFETYSYKSNSKYRLRTGCKHINTTKLSIEFYFWATTFTNPTSLGFFNCFGPLV